MYLGYILAPFSSVITWLVTRKRSSNEIVRLKKEIEGIEKANTGVDISNIKSAIQILTENVVEPLEKELKSVRRELARFRKAIEKVKSCPYEDECPVKEQLHKSEENDDKSMD